MWGELSNIGFTFLSTTYLKNTSIDIWNKGSKTFGFWCAALRIIEFSPKNTFPGALIRTNWICLFCLF